MKKNKHKKINPTKYFKRYLKDKGLFAMYQRSVKPKEGIRNFFRKTNPSDYLTNLPISTVYEKDEIRHIQNSLESYKDDWEMYLKIKPYIEDIKNKFILFLKKRNAYNLYLNCFSPYYVAGILAYRRRMLAWRTEKQEPITLEETTFVNSWDELNPKFYITKAFDKYATIKTGNYWDELNSKWQEELKKYI